MNQTVARALALCVLAATPLMASAQSYPDKPITMVVPFPPGGSTDVIGRLFAVKLGARLGQTVVIENKPGANTGIGAAAVARAAPDGYTFMITGAPTFTSNPLLYPNLNYDPIKSYEYVAVAGSTPFVILTNPQTGIGTVADITSKSAAQPLSFGSFGNGSTPHMAGESLAQRTGAKLLHVPYRGSAPAMTDLIGGQVPFSVDTVTAAIPQLKGGKVKAIAVTTRQRSSQLPQVPTFAEAGYPEVDADTWIMVVAPKGTPAPVRERLEKTLAKIVATPQAQAALQAQGAEPAFAGAAASLAQIERELPLMRAVARRANIQAD